METEKPTTEEDSEIFAKNVVDIDDEESSSTTPINQEKEKETRKTDKGKYQSFIYLFQQYYI